MSSFIRIEDLVANALIENMRRNNKREISFIELNKYGDNIVKWWLINKSVRTAVLSSREYTNILIDEYSGFFEIFYDANNKSYVRLKEDKALEDLIKAFRGYLSLDMLYSFIESFE